MFLLLQLQTGKRLCGVMPPLTPVVLRKRPGDGGPGSPGNGENDDPGKTPGKSTGKEPDDAPVEADDPGGDLLLCRQCGHPVTKTGARTLIHGAHRHVFCNPHGHVFEIGCFHSAPGCAHLGPQTAEFTWFAGYAWQIAVCGACRAHLGWRYAHADGSVFYGLILQQLVEESGEG